MSMLVPPQMLNTMAPAHRRPDQAGFTDALLRRPGSPLHDPGVQRPPYRLALAPLRQPGLTARGRNVGGRGPHPPLPDQGARRAAAHLSAVLRPLHPDGPGRQLHPGDRTSTSSRCRRWTGYAAMFDYLQATPGVRDVVVSGGDVANLPWPRLEGFVGRAAGDRQHPRHPAGHQGADGAAAALAQRRGQAPAWSALGATARERGVSSRSTPTSTLPSR